MKSSLFFKQGDFFRLEPGRPQIHTFIAQTSPGFVYRDPTGRLQESKENCLLHEENFCDYCKNKGYVLEPIGPNIRGVKMVVCIFCNKDGKKTK